METINVMLDIETYSQRKTAAIASIGAVKFTEKEILDKFYVNVNPISCKEYGLHFQKETLEWWSQQDKAVRDALKVDQKSLPESLELFSEWFGSKSLPTWGNGSSFDNVIVEHAYQTVGQKTPWHFRDERCFRTISALFGISHQNNRTGNLHNALDDALSQTYTLQKLFSAKK